MADNRYNPTHKKGKLSPEELAWVDADARRITDELVAKYGDRETLFVLISKYMDTFAAKAMNAVQEREQRNQDAADRKARDEELNARFQPEINRPGNIFSNSR
jgi:hypothetical protein